MILNLFRDRKTNYMNVLSFAYQGTWSDYVNFSVRVQSGDFSGKTKFSMSETMLKQTLVELREIHRLLEGSCILRDYDSDDYIQIEMQRHGQMSIAGQLGGSHNDQFVQFKMLADQTYLESLLSALTSMVQ